MFLEWFINLRRSGVPVTLPEWLDLMRALEHGAVANLDELYSVGLCLLVKSENRYDDYDLAFSASFGDGTLPTELSASSRNGSKTQSRRSLTLPRSQP